VAPVRSRTAAIIPLRRAGGAQPTRLRPLLAPDIEEYRRDIVAFAEAEFAIAPGGEPIRLEEHQKKVLRAIFTAPYPQEVLYSGPKKSGKTAVGALVVLYVALFRAPEGSEVICAANDEEQSRSRVFADVRYAVEHNERLRRGSKITENAITLSSGVVVRAIASDYGSAAGSRHALAVFDELWAYTSERSQRLYEELTPIPTLPFSMRLVVSSAGFEGESRTLRTLYDRGIRGARVFDDLPVWREGGLLMYWDEGEAARRMPWQQGPAGDAYYAEQRESLRPGQFERLHLNHWTAGLESFISADEWDACIDPELAPRLVGDARVSGRVFVGVDVGIKHDSSAVVAVERVDGKDGSFLRLVAHQVWVPAPGEPIEIEATVEAFLRQLLGSRWRVATAYFDPYQFAQGSQRLRRDGHSEVEEFSQTSGNLTLAGNALTGALRGRTLRLYADAEMRRAALQAVAVESGRGWRIAKERSRQRIDVLVALAMAVYAATSAPASSGAGGGFTGAIYSGDLARRRRLWPDDEDFHDPRGAEPKPTDGAERSGS
jgi:phage terminase large subunit-like protein